MTESAAPTTAAAPTNGNLDERLAQLTEKMAQLERTAGQITRILEQQGAKISALESK
jgi:hypothetical protein